VTARRLYWFVVAVGNLALVAGVALWAAVGWKWALLALVGGPVAMVGSAVIALVVFFFVDGGIRADQPCLTRGCSGVVPVQLKGATYSRPFCQACEAKQRALVEEVGRL
jgi:hypothetical protein